MGDNLTPVFVMGRRRFQTNASSKAQVGMQRAPLAIVAVTPTSTGFKQRCNTDATLNVDYISGETVDDLSDWWTRDFTRFTVHDTLEEATEHRNLML